MKTITLITLSLSLLVFSNVQAMDTPPSAKESVKKGKKIEIEVEIEPGRVKKGCTGFGICGIIVSGGIKGVENPTTAMPYVVGNEIVALEFLKLGDIRGEAIASNFKLGYYLMEEPFSANLKTKAGELKLNWPAGKHPAVKTAAGWMVSPN